jgi:hypothetical protein
MADRDDQYADRPRPNETSAAFAKRTNQVPPGFIIGTAPDGKTPIFVRKPRAKGPWFRVKHQNWGSKEVQAKDRADAIRKYLLEKQPTLADDKDGFEFHAKYCRVAELPERKPVAA